LGQEQLGPAAGLLKQDENFGGPVALSNTKTKLWFKQ